MTKSFLLTGAFAALLSFSAFSQSSEDGILPPADSKEGVFTEWKKVEFSTSSGTGSYEYRIAFDNRKALACYYTIEVKNTCSEKINVNVKTHYYDKLVKSNFGDELKATIKPGKITAYDVITQGAKADKEKKDQPDIERCLGCDFSYTVSASMDK
jgi:hypothetical protein